MSNLKIQNSKLEDQITQDMISAQKAGDTKKLATFRMLRSAIHNAQIAARKELKDEDIVDVIQKEIKSRRDSISQFKKGGRQDLVENEEQEIKILEKYLPEQLSDEELSKIINQAISDTKAESIKDIGKVMSQVMPKIKGRADGGKVSELVKSKLTK